MTWLRRLVSPATRSVTVSHKDLEWESGDRRRARLLQNHEEESDIKSYLGVDLHRTQLTVCTRLENGRTYLRRWPMRELKLFAAQLRKDDEIAVEASGNTRLFYYAVVNHVAQVLVVNPTQFKVINQSVKKTDSNDAELLALCLSKGLLPQVRMKDQEHRSLSYLAQMRDLLVKQGAALKGKINNLLSAEGINLQRETLSSKKALARVLVDQIRSLNSSIAELEELIEEEGSKLAGHKNLVSIKGIGPVSATVLLTAIGKIEDFAEPIKLAAKQGNKLARTALVLCSLIAKRFSPYLQRFYQRIQRRRGGGKANIALARKFLGVIDHTLKNNWVFEDFPNFVPAF
jgi:transposase